MKPVALLTMVGIMVVAASSGCSWSSRYTAPDVEYLSSISPGSRFVVFEPKVTMPLTSKRMPYVRHEIRLEVDRWQKSMETAFRKAGHDVAPWSEVKPVITEMNPRFLVEKKPLRIPVLKQMGIDNAVFFDVSIKVRKGKRVNERIVIRIYDTKSGELLETIRWRIDLAKMEVAAES